MKLLLENQTENTDGSQDTEEINQNNFPPNFISVFAEGTFDGAIVTLKYLREGGSEWAEAGINTTFSETGAGNIWVTGKVQIRFDLTNAGASTEVTAGIL